MTMAKKTATANTFEHNGVPIILTTQGQFAAIVNGIEVRRPSLDAMRNYLDKAKPFEPFDAIHISHYRGHEIESFKIIGTKPDKSICAPPSGLLWLGQRGRTYREVLRDTPANRAKLKAYAKERAEIRKQEEALEERMSELEKTIEGETPAPAAK